MPSDRRIGVAEDGDGGMDLATDILRAGLLFWLAALAGILLYRLLVGEISMAGLLRTRAADGSSVVNPERLQAVLLVLIVLGAYVIDALRGGVVKDAEGLLSMPDVPDALLVLLAGSKGLYLAGKIQRTS